MRRPGANRATCVVEVGVSLPRRISGQVILVMSGRSRMMYQCLQPEPEGAILPKRSAPQEVTSSPHDADASMSNWLETNIQGGAVASTPLPDYGKGSFPTPGRPLWPPTRRPGTEADSLAELEPDYPTIRHIVDRRGEVRQEPPTLVRRDGRQVDAVRRLLGAEGWVRG